MYSDAICLRHVLYSIVNDYLIVICKPGIYEPLKQTTKNETNQNFPINNKQRFKVG